MDSEPGDRRWRGVKDGARMAVEECRSNGRTGDETDETGGELALEEGRGVRAPRRLKMAWRVGLAADCRSVDSWLPWNEAWS